MNCKIAMPAMFSPGTTFRLGEELRAGNAARDQGGEGWVYLNLTPEQYANLTEPESEYSDSIRSAEQELRSMQSRGGDQKHS